MAADNRPQVTVEAGIPAGARVRRSRVD
jgi:hypothetical protein